MPLLWGGGSVPLLGRRGGALAGGAAEPGYIDVPLAHRWRASDLGLADGAAVSTWEDSSGGLVQTLAGGTATYRELGGTTLDVPGVEFAAGYMDCGAGAVSLADLTVFVVYETAGTANMGFAASRGGGPEWSIYKVGSELRFRSDAVNLARAGWASSTGSDPHVFGGRRVTGSGLARLTGDGQTPFTGTFTGAAATDGIALGQVQGATGSLAFSGVLYDVLIYAEGLTDADMDTVQAALQDEYGIT